MHRGWILYINSVDTLRFSYPGGSIVASTGTIINDGWHHLAVTRYGTTVTFYIDGTQSGSGTVSNGTLSTGANFLIGVEDSSNSNPFIGYFDDFRLTKGFSRYQNSFTSPSGLQSIICGDPYWDKVSLALPLVGNNGSTTIIDNSSNSIGQPITNSSVIYASSDIRRFGSSQGTASSFNGAAKLTLNPNGRWADMRGDYTIEFWFNATSVSGSPIFITFDGSAGHIRTLCWNKWKFKINWIDRKSWNTYSWNECDWFHHSNYKCMASLRFIKKRSYFKNFS